MTNLRIQQLRKQIQKHDLDALLISFPPNYHYATTHFDGSNGLCVLTKNSAYFLSDFRYKEQAKAQTAKGWDVIIPDGGVGGLYKGVLHYKLLGKAKRIGFEADHTSVSMFNSLKKMFTGVSLVPTSLLVENCVAVKEPWEIDRIKTAAKISAKVFNEILSMVKPGIVEKDIANEMTYLHKQYGADGDAFDTIIASGIRSSMPHGRASDKKIKNHEFITIDFGCTYKGYNCDITRTVALGKPTAEMRKIYSIVYEAQQRGFDAARAGISPNALDKVSRDVIAGYGYGKFFGHSLGHGLGLQVHESPRVGQGGGDDPMKENYVITIEPGIYFPKKFGVRIEDDIRLRKGACEMLTPQLPKELIVL